MTDAAKPSNGAQEDLLAKNDAEFAAGFERLYSQTWGEGRIPAKYKELCGASLSVFARCEGCLAYHIRMATGAGATADELIEAMRIGLLSGGSVTIPTVRSGYKTLQELGLI
jgi:AhpD family alkylhydroperoxidase